MMNYADNRRIVITGLGVISSIGNGWKNFWDSLLEGHSGISPVFSFDTSNHFTHYGGEIKDFDPFNFIPEQKVHLYSRASQLALTAMKFAIEDSKLTNDIISNIKTGTCIGTTSGSIQTIEKINDRLIKNDAVESELFFQLPTHTTPAMIARELNLNGPNYIFSTACAAGNYAIGYGFDLIRMKKADIVFAGASDPFSRISFTGFNQFKAVAPEKCQPFDKNRKGMMVAEGSAILVLESLTHAIERGAPIYAEILGYGLSCDAQHMTQPSVEGLVRCMLRALSESGIQREDVDYISAHGTGTPTNDKAESAAIKEVFGSRYKEIPVSSIKSMIGHTMGAASALEAVSCALTVKNDIIPPTINFETPDPECDIDCVPNKAREHKVTIALNNSFAFGGNNACLVLKKFISQGER
ncbi:MAG: beta-ketoacyl-[acyl-carrier-protein] synthase family protein [Nitrospirae bacterium]|nr:beta-ketoacyl-[acyl-carrier-protein] synthase family protein [Nitrospirota bacterium]